LSIAWGDRRKREDGQKNQNRLGSILVFSFLGRFQSHLANYAGGLPSSTKRWTGIPEGRTLPLKKSNECEPPKMGNFQFSNFGGYGVKGSNPLRGFCPKGETSNRALKNFEGTHS
jgi:hypothetical protein